MPGAGSLRHPIRFEARQQVRDPQYGQPLSPWAPIADADDWAEDLTESGEELTSADQRQANTKHVYRVRYRTDVTAAMRLIDLNEGGTGWVMEITAAHDKDGRRKYLTMECLEQTTGATTANT